SAIRGTVVDQQSQFPLPGVTVVLKGSSPLLGTATDIDGQFRLENVPVGRHQVEFSFIGYETITIPNVLVVSGKEFPLDVKLVESLIELEGAEVVAEDNKTEALNEMSTVSARTFTVEEASRYSGSLQDPSRMAQNYAGVSNASDDRNDIIIRGNSPSGVLWRMEGIDIPSPNHFASFGTTGGPVSMLNINNLSNSDFMTSAFAPEYGNALAGVFDLNLRNGNTREYEFLGQVGFNGFEFGAEGPLGIGSNSSFLVNYRYSTLGVLSAMGLEFGTGTAVPQYQDLTFKLDVPTKKAGRFSLFGVGGVSFIEFLAEDATENNLFSEDSENSQFGSETGWVGLSHKYFFNEKTSSKVVIAASRARTDGFIDSLGVVDRSPNRVFGTDNQQNKYSAVVSVNSKRNARNTIKVGLQYDLFDFNIQDSVLVNNDYFYQRMDFQDATSLIQGHATWQHRFNEKATFTGGLHTQTLLLNESTAIEPRVGLRYQVNPTNSLNIGLGMHSQMQPIPIYFVQQRIGPSEFQLNNDQLGFNRSLHAVIGHDWNVTEFFRFKTEVYYQYLYDIAVDRESSSFSLLNFGADFLIPDNGDLVNEGTGENYGLELTAERFFHKGFYALATASLFESTYRGSDDVQRSTAFNGNYVFNVLGGKEWKIGKNHLFTLDSRVTYAGGRWYTPIDFAASQEAGAEVRDEERAFSEQFDPYFRWDVKFGVKINGKNVAQQFSIDLRNVTNYQNIFSEEYNNRTGEIQTRYQNGFFPDVQYRIYF
ncbi:MAG: TonB-dependent receptor, partial [Flavobacteriales bacterium]|nr:TonB-dependent receptor [Flavobacteriales bacterium]